MQRRGFLLGSMAGLATASFMPAQAQAATGRKIAVIGAGIIGASIAYHLAARGAQVTVLEAKRPAAGATENSFAWLNAFSKQPHAYYDLNLLGILAWHRLQAELGSALPIQWGGMVRWSNTDSSLERLQETLARQHEWGYPTRLIGADAIGELLPGVTPGPVASAVFSAVEGTVNPKHVAEILLAQAKRLGASVEYPAVVTGFDRDGDRVRAVRTAAGAMDVDGVAIAAGLGTTALAGMLGANVPVHSSIGILAHTAAQPPMLSRIALGPGANIKQNPDGGIVTGASFEGTPGLEATPELGNQLLRNAERFLPALKGVPLDFATAGHRVLPKDGFPIVGKLPGSANVHVAAMHSGMTLGALMGQLVSGEMLDGVRADLLADFRPERFA